MPTYDYRRSDGTFFEASRPYGQHYTAADDNGVCGTLVWNSMPGVRIPPWHQSAPRESAEAIANIRRLEDPDDPLRELDDTERRRIVERKRERDVEQERRRDHTLHRAIQDAST